MEVQIFGVNNNNDVRKAQRFFKERRARVHFMDFKQKVVAGSFKVPDDPVSY